MTPALRGLKDPQTRKLAEVLDGYTRPGELGETLGEGKVRCLACGHRCVILPGHRGICRVRYNEAGTLYVPWGYVAALQNDPVEKKPFYHVLPGSYALTFGMLGCDFHCSFCQNWVTSQALRDPRAVARIYEVSPGDLVRMAEEAGARLVISSYNEPLITAEWAHAVFTEAHRRGFVTGFVSNGNATQEVLSYLRPVMDLMKVDLKTMNPRRYRELGGVLDRVLDTIGTAHSLGFWVELVTLVIPGWNDDPEEIRAAARWIRDVDPAMPWHLTAFHPDYRMTDRSLTPLKTLQRAADIAREEGLQFVYIGNVPGIGRGEDTVCPECGTVLIRRRGFRILENRLQEGRCPSCCRTIPGVWRVPEREREA